MSRYRKQMWREEKGPEPFEYQMEKDPLHGSDFSDVRERMMFFITEVTKVYKLWISDHTRNIEIMLHNLKKQWRKEGGNNEQWETINKSAISKSGYAKAISAEANNIEKLKSNQRFNDFIASLQSSKSKFNGLNLSGIKV